MQSILFSADKYVAIQKKIKSFLNKQEDFLSERTISSPRAAGDAIQSLLEDNIEQILGDIISEYSADFARRAMADVAFTDRNDCYHVVDIKTHRLDTHFNMPNLTSVERLARFYEDDKNHFVILMIAYSVSGNHLEVKKVHFVPIEFLSWECLTIGALGWGQIQIANSNNILTIPHNHRKKWMLELCEVMLAFYPKEISKIDTRIEYFKKVKARWRKK
jgi:hypothetical protein